MARPGGLEPLLVSRGAPPPREKIATLGLEGEIAELEAARNQWLRATAMPRCHADEQRTLQVIACQATCVRTYSASALLMSVWYPMLRRLASFRKRASTSGSRRIAMSRRARVPSGGRPTRRIARSCAPDASGRSEKSIFLRATVRRPFFSARSPRGDDSDRVDMSRSPLGVGHHQHSARDGPPEAEKPTFVGGVANVRAVQAARIREDGGSLVERDIVLGQVSGGLACVPFEHLFKYIHKSRRLRQEVPCRVPCQRVETGSKTGAFAPRGNGSSGKGRHAHRASAFAHAVFVRNSGFDVRSFRREYG